MGCEKVRIQKGQNNGIDDNKKVKGIKRHVVVDKNGFLIAVMVTIACVHDGKAAYLLARCLKELCCNLKVILSDAGYRGEVADNICFLVKQMLI